jgi:acyl-CoA synthetase (AMP-forming)/AMP-acid ligase II
MMGALARELDAACAAHGPACGLSDRGGALTLAELAALAGSVEAALRGAGCRPGEPVAVQVSNRARDLGALWGIWRAGAVAAPLHRTSPPAVTQRLLDRLQARFIADADPPPTAGPLTVLDRPEPPVRPLLRDAALIVFTSGTTGQPKGAVLSHAALAGKLAANNTLLHFGPGTRTLLVLQITFSFGMWVSLLTLSRGGWLHLEEKFEARRFLPALAAGRITDVALVPTMIRSLFAAQGDPELRRQIDELGGLQHLRRLLTGGENLGTTLGQRLKALFTQAEIVDIYGLTETSTCDFFLLPQDQARYSGCIGRPGPGIAYRLADGQGNVAARGEPGELQIRTPYLMNGYLDAPDLTAQAVCDGYFRTGDIAREREGGVVELVGRSKELISRGANKVSPLEIEHVLAGHPAVAEALATGVPDAVLGERIHALIVLRGGATATEAELGAWAAARLERYKCPDRIHFGTELPLGPTGKSDRNRLRELLSRR